MRYQCERLEEEKQSMVLLLHAHPHITHFSMLQPAKALASVESLERLNSNYYRQRYPREEELSFTGDLIVKNPWILSNGI